MNDTPQPVAPAARRIADGSDTLSHAIEATGSPHAGGSGTDVMPRVGEYVLVRKLGEGGMGAVYLADDTRLQRKAAIKTMRPELAAEPANRDRFEREARAAAAVEHDNIVPVWGVGEADDGTPYIAMPFLQGETLDARLKREPVSSLRLILKVAREVADGLAAAHAKGLIHRDIKPGNVWLEGDLSAKQLAEQVRRCKILDFGLARAVDKDDAQITASGAILGTPAYMAPEQARGEKVDHRADLFSLGVMLYRMATGGLPFKGPNAMAVLVALTTRAPAPVRELAPSLPAAVADLIERLMAKDPTGRPQSAAEASAAMRQVIKDIQAKKAPSTAPPPSPAPGSHPVPVHVLPAPAPNPWEDVTEVEEEAPLARSPEPKKSRALWHVSGALLSLLLLGAALAVIVVRVETAEGTLVVEINDPDVEARVKSGKLVLLGPDGKERYTLSPATEHSKTIGAGAYTIRVEGADGLALDTREFTLKKNGEVRVRVTLDAKAARKADPRKGDLDRKAAEYILAIGGAVRVDGQEADLTTPAQLPPTFQLTAVRAGDNPRLGDSGLAVLRECANLQHVELVRAPGAGTITRCRPPADADARPRLGPER